VDFSTIGTALRARRDSLHIDQARAAAMVGMSRTSYSSYERDLQRPSVEVLPGLAQFLDVSTDDVLTLYGGTCIEAIRPALEQLLASPESSTPERAPVSDETPTQTTPETPVIHDSRAASEEPSRPEVEADTVEMAVVESEPERVSASIFANELSEDNFRSATRDVVPDEAEKSPKPGKGKNGKKKKKKNKKS
jgi:transcriptional regulator with XRE-family HTH domain